MKIYLRTTRKDAKGQSVVYFIIHTEWISTNFKTAPEHWDAANEIFKPSHPQFAQLTGAFILLKQRAKNYLQQLELDRIAFNKKHFLSYLFNNTKVSVEELANPLFAQLITEYINNTELGFERVKHYQVIKSEIEAIAHNCRLLDVDFKFIHQYKKHLLAKKNCQNTCTRKIKQIKAVIHYCQKSGLLKMDPLAFVKLPAIKGNKQYLTAAELKTLEILYQQGTLTDAQQCCLQYFLFSCYTALRFSDIQKIEVANIVNGSIEMEQQKTKRKVFVPLIDKAAALINTNTAGKLFATFTNQASNRFLKEITLAAGIEKNLTYHCSRHTFGTLSIYWGIPQAIVAEIMGVDITTVKVYAQIIDEVKIREMSKWGKVG